MEKKINIEVPENVEKLADKLSSKAELFIVGGYVRNALLGFDGADIDLTARITPEKMVSLLKNTKFEVIEKSYKMGGMHMGYGGKIFGSYGA